MVNLNSSNWSIKFIGIHQRNTQEWLEEKSILKCIYQKTNQLIIIKLYDKGKFEWDTHTHKDQDYLRLFS